MLRSLVGSEMCIRDRQIEDSELGTTLFQHDPVGNLEAAVYGDFTAVFRSCLFIHI